MRAGSSSHRKQATTPNKAQTHNTHKSEPWDSPSAPSSPSAPTSPPPLPYRSACRSRNYRASLAATSCSKTKAAEATSVTGRAAAAWGAGCRTAARRHGRSGTRRLNVGGGGGGVVYCRLCERRRAPLSLRSWRWWSRRASSAIGSLRRRRRRRR